jgi:hypothetical protein
MTKPSSCQSALNAFLDLTSKEEQVLQGAYERVEDGCRDLIALKFPAAVLVFLADADTDTIEVRCQEPESLDFSTFHCVETLSPWSSLIGQPFGWGWLTVNQQAYLDGALVGFSGLEPSVLLYVEASALRVFAVTEAP